MLRLAEEHDIDLAQVTGTGEGGRITRKDVLAYVANRGAAAASEAPQPEAVPAQPVAPAAPRWATPQASAAAAPGDQVIDPSPIRRTIARRMVESKHNAPHAWTMVEADVTRLAAIPESVKA